MDWPNWNSIFLGALMLIGAKSLIFGQYWPWQYRTRCPHCKREWPEGATGEKVHAEANRIRGEK